MIETSIETLAIDADTPDKEALEGGALPQVVIQVVGGTSLPIADPSTNRPLRFPSIAVNFALTRESALEFAKLVKEKAESLPSGPSGKIITASSLDEVAKVADITSRLKR